MGNKVDLKEILIDRKIIHKKKKLTNLKFKICLYLISLLRNIDKLRLIELSLKDIFHFKHLYQFQCLKHIKCI
jgi:hypothetical protein